MTESLTTSIPRIVVSGLRGGGGKTILSLCIIASWHKQGLKVAPFKKGPDYIDAGWLAKAAGAPCYNLDLFMMSSIQAVQSFVSHSFNARLSVIEGNRGLYDGVDHEGTYSTAQLAKLLGSPVILVVDCTKATNTLSAMVLGCQKTDPGLNIAGVVLNNVATGRQESIIRRSIDSNCGIPVLGAVPRLKKDPFPERHMGLVPFQEHPAIQHSITILTEIGAKYLHLDGILRIAEKAETLKVKKTGRSESRESAASRPAPAVQNPPLRIGVIRDSAFQFYYEDNFEELRRRGAELVEASPLREKKLPDLDALYIGGGFPETHAIALSENTVFKNSIIKSIENGLPVYAECGGLMYLGKSIVLKNKTYQMAGVFPVVFSLEKKPQAHGYTIAEVDRTNPYFPEGSSIKGHEFHYSRVIDIKSENAQMAFKMKRGHGIIDGLDGLCYKNTLAAYTHIHALGTPEWADGMIKCAVKYNKLKRKGEGT
jgi:cobyrinic acid a,c-diamide synthase